MNVFIKLAISFLLPVIVAAAAITGCAQIRELTYPEGFTYLDKKEVESLMQKMGEGMMRLDSLVEDAAVTDTVRQQSIVAELSSIERIAVRLSGGHTQTNQFVISDHIEQFISDVGTARMFANASPPNYNKARDVGNSCKECHQFR